MPTTTAPKRCSAATSPTTTYVVELAITAAGSTLYVYKKGQSRGSGYSSTLNVAWTRARSRIQANRANDEVAYLDNLAEQPGVAADQHTRTVYDAAGRAVYSIDDQGGLTQYDYDSAGNVTAKRTYFNRLPVSIAANEAAIDAKVATAASPTQPTTAARTMSTTPPIVWLTASMRWAIWCKTATTPTAI